MVWIWHFPIWGTCVGIFFATGITEVGGMQVRYIFIGDGGGRGLVGLHYLV